MLAAAGDVAVETGARSAAAWLADDDQRGPRHRTPPRDFGGRAGPSGGSRLPPRSQPARSNLAQIRVIADALEALPARISVRTCWPRPRPCWSPRQPSLGPRELKVFGSRVLEYLAPEIAEEADYKRLLAAGAPRSRRDEAVLPTPRRRLHRPQRPGPGPRRQPAPKPTSTATPHLATTGSATSTTCHCRGAAARRSAPSWRTCPLPACHGRAAPPPPSRSPSTWQTLLADLGTAGVAVTSTGDKMSADQARRLACTAGIMPVRDERQVRDPRPGPREELSSKTPSASP